MTNRFDFEASMLHCWNVCDDIQMLADVSHKMNPAEIYNVLMSLKIIYEVKFQKLQEDFENMA